MKGGGACGLAASPCYPGEPTDKPRVQECVLVRVLQKTTASRIYRRRIDSWDYKGDKSSDLQSASWRRRGANDKSSSLNGSRLETQEGRAMMFQFKSGSRKSLMLQLEDHQAGVPPDSRKDQSLCFITSSPDWVKPTHIGESNLRYSVY